MLKILKFTFAFVVIALLTTAATLGMVRSLYLPGTACTVSQSAAEGLDMKLSYGEANARLGCAGVLIKRETWSTALRREVYHWRGDAWPFGRLEGVFYNDSLEAKEVRWIVLNLSLPSVAGN